MNYYIGLSLASGSSMDSGVAVIDENSQIILLDKLYKVSDIIFFFENYANLNYSKICIVRGRTGNDIDELAALIDKIEKKAITKLCKIGAVKIISMNIGLNFEIIKYAIDSKIINIESIKIFLDSDENGLIIKVFDKDNFEKQGRKKIRINARTLEVKQRRKLNLFN